MKKILLLLAVFAAVEGYGQKPKASPHDTVSTKDITVTYGRPYKKGRDVFGGLEKFGQVWRLGADEATTIKFDKPTKFGDKVVPAGTYTLFALVDQKEWTFILNGVLGQWGAYGYDKNKEKDIAYAKAAVTKLENTVEQLTIRFDGEDMIVEWDGTGVKVKVKPEK
ncbi:MAG TPA: DUF2911 domain-containing protein [Chitinophagaceae bacterium]|jgi:hypothetical protein|nr:DUF2911 domain-containing protein [Chitinophagaceae bacterium]